MRQAAGGACTAQNESNSPRRRDRGRGRKEKGFSDVEGHNPEKVVYYLVLTLIRGLPVTMCTQTAPADHTDDSGDVIPPSTVSRDNVV